MAELKPCPFCGGKAKLESAKANAVATRLIFWVQCNLETAETCSCIPRTWNCDTPEEAIEAWNRRAENG